MKNSEFKRLGRQALSLCLVTIVLLTYSMVALAASAPVGEIVVSTKTLADSASVTVNGEPAKTGRTIFSPSIISTPENGGATLNLGKAGKIELGPNTTFTLSSDSTTVSGDLTAGSVTVLSAANAVNVKTLSGELVKLNAGETATAASGTASKKAKPGPGGLDWAYWGIIIGGTVLAVVLIATVGDNNTSPTR